MANAPVLKTGVRKDLGVRIPRPPLYGSWRMIGPDAPGTVTSSNIAVTATFDGRPVPPATIAAFHSDGGL